MNTIADDVGLDVAEAIKAKLAGRLEGETAVAGSYLIGVIINDTGELIVTVRVPVTLLE